MAVGKRLEAAQYAEGILAGNRLILSRAITLIESSLPADAALAAQVMALLPQPQQPTFRLGITGVPGVGKSTFIESFGQQLLEQGHKLAVLAVDPSSPLTGGSILGDKTRMELLSRHPQAYVRPSPAGEALGGITLKTRDAMILCEAAGFDFIIVETVGVGQSETTVQQVTDFFLLLMLAGAGDELQGIKRGIMELADAIVITKADGENLGPAQLARATYLSALHLLPAQKSFWTPDVVLTSALSGDGVPEVVKLLKRFEKEATRHGWLAQNRKRQAVEALHDYVQHQLLMQFYSRSDVQAAFTQLEKQVADNELTALQAALQLLKK